MLTVEQRQYWPIGYVLHNPPTPEYLVMLRNREIGYVWDTSLKYLSLTFPHQEINILAAHLWGVVEQGKIGISADDEISNPRFVVDEEDGNVSLPYNWNDLVCQDAIVQLNNLVGIASLVKDYRQVKDSESFQSQGDEPLRRALKWQGVFLQQVAKKRPDYHMDDIQLQLIQLADSIVETENS